MAAQLPSFHAVPSGRGVPLLLGVWGASPENVRIFKAPGCILGHFWTIWLSVLVSLNKAFAA